MKTRNRRKGFTLVELIVAMTLAVIVLGVAGLFFQFSFTAQKLTETEFTIQSQIRLAAEVVNKSIRNATVTFTIPQDLFYVEGGPNNKMPGWNYLGVEDNNKIVQYTYTNTTGTGTVDDPFVAHHTRKVLVDTEDNVEYNLYFSKTIPNNGETENSKLIKFNLECYVNDSEHKRISVKSELSAMNSLVVEDGGTPSDPATALAYRSDPTPQPYIQPANPIDIAITLVLDDSGSMADKILDPTTGVLRTKKAIMKDEATKLVRYFAGINGVKICVIPYGSTANPVMDPDGTYGFSDASDSEEDLVLQISNLNGDGDATNTGDALRRAYYALRDFNDDYDGTIVNYVILLTDGNPTKYSKKTNANYVNVNSYLLADGRSVYQNSSGSDVTSTTIGYANFIGQQLIVGGDLDITTYLIGFTANEDDVDNAEEITLNCGGEYYYAGDPVALKNTFSSIASKMLTETWHIYGPYPQ